MNPTNHNISFQPNFKATKFDNTSKLERTPPKQKSIKESFISFQRKAIQNFEKIAKKHPLQVAFKAILQINCKI